MHCFKIYPRIHFTIEIQVQSFFLQFTDVGTSDAVESGEKWFTFDVEQEKKIEEYISSQR